MTDTELRQDIEQELDWDPRVDSRDVGVAVKDGVVTLTGHVRSFAQRLAAERAAQSVAGVKAVANDVGVKVPLGEERTDTEIAAIAVAMLQHNATAPKDIQVIVRDGCVSLEGHVDNWFEKSAAEAIVAGQHGIKGVANNLVIRRQATQPDVQARIREAFRRRALTECGKVNVVCDSGVVTLEGQVRSLQDREAIETAVWQAQGVIQVIDNLRVAA